MMAENEEVIKNLQANQILRQGELVPFSPYRIRPYDQLMIRVNAFDGTTEQFLGQEFSDNNAFSRNLNYDPASTYFNSYAVDERGYVNLPIINNVKAVGKTMQELQSELDSLYLPYLKFARTNVKLSNMRVTVLGEVNEPGLHYLFNDRNTILDVLSLAGNATPFADLTKVKLIRTAGNNSITVYINMASPDFIYSEYFFMQPYDVIYLEPVKAKSFDSSSQSVGIVLSAISIIVFLANIFIK
jgi:polysaccharide export outer membrane protein